MLKLHNAYAKYQFLALSEMPAKRLPAGSLHSLLVVISRVMLVEAHCCILQTLSDLLEFGKYLQSRGVSPHSLEFPELLDSPSNVCEQNISPPSQLPVQ